MNFREIDFRDRGTSEDSAVDAKYNHLDTSSEYIHPLSLFFPFPFCLSIFSSSSSHVDRDYLRGCNQLSNAAHSERARANPLDNQFRFDRRRCDEPELFDATTTRVLSGVFRDVKATAVRSTAVSDRGRNRNVHVTE